MLAKLNKFHKTPLGYLVFGVIELGASFVFISVAIDRGNLLWYVLAIIALAGGVDNLAKLASRMLVKGKHDKTRATGKN